MGNVLKHVFSGEQALSLFPTTRLGINPQATGDYLPGSSAFWIDFASDADDPVNFYRINLPSVPEDPLVNRNEL